MTPPYNLDNFDLPSVLDAIQTLKNQLHDLRTTKAGHEVAIADLEKYIKNAENALKVLTNLKTELLNAS